MPRHSQEVREQLLDLCWSLWTGLGVPGQVDNHYDIAIDPEPLILFTTALGDADPRLRDEATDWCIRHGSLVSGTRLRNLLARESEPVRAAYGEFAATVAGHSSLRWPLRTKARRHEPRLRPRVQAFDRPSQIALRLRGMMGVGARADIVRVFLGAPDEAFGAADLAAEIAYSKRNTAQALEALRLAGIAEAFPVRNQVRFRLISVRAEQLADLLDPLPGRYVRWSPALSLLVTAIAVIERHEGRASDVRAVEAMSFVKEREHEIRAARLPAPRSDIRGAVFWDEFVTWLSIAVNKMAAGGVPAGDRFEMPPKSRAHFAPQRS